MMQLSLLELETKMDQQFREFHEANPKVYAELLALTRQAHERGRKKIGIGMLFEVLRWNRFIQTSDPDFKLNNNWRSRYARMIMELNPGLDGIFETRGLHS